MIYYNPALKNGYHCVNFILKQSSRSLCQLQYIINIDLRKTHLLLSCLLSFKLQIEIASSGDRRRRWMFPSPRAGALSSRERVFTPLSKEGFALEYRTHTHRDCYQVLPRHVTRKAPVRGILQDSVLLFIVYFNYQSIICDDIIHVKRNENLLAEDKACEEPENGTKKKQGSEPKCKFKIVVRYGRAYVVFFP